MPPFFLILLLAWKSSSVTSSFYCLCQTFWRSLCFCAWIIILFSTTKSLRRSRIRSSGHESFSQIALRCLSSPKRIVSLQPGNIKMKLKCVCVCVTCQCNTTALSRWQTRWQGSCHNVVTKYSQRRVTLCWWLHNSVNTHLKQSIWIIRSTTPRRAVVQHQSVSVSHHTRWTDFFMCHLSDVGFVRLDERVRVSVHEYVSILTSPTVLKTF